MFLPISKHIFSKSFAKTRQFLLVDREVSTWLEVVVVVLLEDIEEEEDALNLAAGVEVTARRDAEWIAVPIETLLDVCWVEKTDDESEDEENEDLRLELLLSRFWIFGCILKVKILKWKFVYINYAKLLKILDLLKLV